MIYNASSERNYNIDLIKTVALFLVAAIHSFLYLNYYLITLNFSLFPFLFTMLRQLCICCVPLFLLSTGYLNCGKQIKTDKIRIINLLRILIPYVVSTLFISLYFKIRNIDHDPIDMLFGMEKYAYGWYVEMFIGLYLLIPYINIAYNKIKTKKNKLILIGILFFLTHIPSLLKYGEDDFSIDYWDFLYPITYYLIGGYIKEYGISVKQYILTITMFGSVLSNTAIYIFVTNGFIFEWTSQVSYKSFFVLITSVCLFCLLLTIDLTTLPSFFKKLIMVISVSTLPAYLISKICDEVVYDFVIKLTSQSFMENYRYMVFTVFAVFFSSAILGIPIQKAANLLTKKALKYKDKLVLKIT